MDLPKHPASAQTEQWAACPGIVVTAAGAACMAGGVGLRAPRAGVGLSLVIGAGPGR